MKRNAVILNEKKMARWDWPRNNADGIDPTEITDSSKHEAWFHDDNCGHHWQAKIKDTGGCPFCNGKRVLIGFNDLKSQRPDIACEYADDLNTLKSDEITVKSGLKVWWRGIKCGHHWQATVASRVICGNGCPFCANRRLLVGFNDMLTMYPMVASVWSPLNGFKPDEVMYGTHKMFILKGLCGHEWKCSSKRLRISGIKCPYCNDELVYSGLNDLMTKRPDLLIDWDYARNAAIGIAPDNILFKSCKYVWWKCHDCCHEWKCTLANRTMQGSGCPQCARKYNNEEDDFAVMLAMEFPDARIERNVRILKVELPDGSSSTWEVDFIIDGMFAIEFNGEYWHSDEVIIRNHHMTALSYHTMKHDAIMHAGMVPLFAWEDDWLNRRDELIASLYEVINDCNPVPALFTRLSSLFS